MPFFNFSSPKKKTKNKSNNRCSILNSNVTGIIFIDINGNYYVNYNNNCYSIDKSCYTCKGKSIIYGTPLYNTFRLRYIREKNCRFECNNINWLPFGIGCIVNGDIITNDIESLFLIKKCFIENNDKSREAINFYKTNKEKLYEIYINKKLNECY